MLWMLGTDRIFKNPQRRDKCEDVAVAQFWVRNAGSWEECYLGKKELKKKSSTAGEGFCIKCFISGAATIRGWSHLAG